MEVNGKLRTCYEEVTSNLAYTPLPVQTSGCDHHVGLLLLI